MNKISFGVRVHNYSAFVQDDWRVRSNLLLAAAELLDVGHQLGKGEDADQHRQEIEAAL